MTCTHGAVMNITPMRFNWNHKEGCARGQTNNWCVFQVVEGFDTLISTPAKRMHSGIIEWVRQTHYRHFQTSNNAI